MVQINDPAQHYGQNTLRISKTGWQRLMQPYKTATIHHAWTMYCYYCICRVVFRSTWPTTERRPLTSGPRPLSTPRILSTDNTEKQVSQSIHVQRQNIDASAGYLPDRRERAVSGFCLLLYKSSAFYVMHLFIILFGVCLNAHQNYFQQLFTQGVPNLCLTKVSQFWYEYC